MNSLKKFGKFMVANLRDTAVAHHLKLQRGELKAPAIRDLQSQVVSLSSEQKELLLRVVDAIDTAMHDIIFAIQDAHDRRMRIELAVDGHNIAQESGMLQGEPLGDNG